LVSVGERAPDVELVDTDLRKVKISSFKGKPAVIAFFPGAFTSVCTKEMCTFRDSMNAFNSVGSQVVGVSVDPPFSLKAFKEQNSLNYTLLSDYSREAVRAFGVAAENFAGLRGYTAAKRSVFVLNSQGVVTFKWVSDDPRVEPDYNKVSEEASRAK
jgi:peroxiredoxin